MKPFPAILLQLFVLYQATEHTTGKDRTYLANFPDVAEKAAQTIDAARATAIPSAAEPAQSAGSGRGARR